MLIGVFLVLIKAAADIMEINTIFATIATTIADIFSKLTMLVIANITIVLNNMINSASILENLSLLMFINIIKSIENSNIEPIIQNIANHPSYSILFYYTIAQDRIICNKKRNGQI